MLVTVGLSWILLRDELADFFFHALAGDIFPIFHGDRALEKMLEFKEPLRRVNVFVRRGPTHGGLMHVDILGHVAQHHRFESLDSMVEKLLLEFENALSDAIESLLALLNAFDQPSGCANFLL